MRKIILIIMALAGLIMAEQVPPMRELSDIDQKFRYFLFDYTRGSNADTNIAVRNLIKAGANKNLIAHDGTKAMAYIACYSETKDDAEAVSYLSSIGADSFGMDQFCENGYVYDKPKVFENKHIKLSAFDVTLGGGGKVVCLNKTDEPIYIIKIIYQVVGHKERIFTYKRPLTIPIGEEPEISIDYWLPLDMSHSDAYYKQFPKIINNKVQKFQRQMSVIYRYKGKEYTFKTPKMTEEWNATYPIRGNEVSDLILQQ